MVFFSSQKGIMKEKGGGMCKLFVFFYNIS